MHTATAQDVSAQPPLSTSGAGVLAPLVPAAPASAAPPVEIARETYLRTLEARIVRLEQDASGKPAAPTPATPPGALPAQAGASAVAPFQLQMYIQPQFFATFANAAGSANPAGSTAAPNDVVTLPDGTTTNRTLFRSRRARIRFVAQPSKHARGLLELEAFPFGTPGTFVRNALGTVIAHYTDAFYTEFSAGVGTSGFGLELAELPRERLFVERNRVDRVFFPSTADTGVFIRTSGFNQKLSVLLGVVNGYNIGNGPARVLPDLNRGKDVYMYASYKFGPLTLGAGGWVGSGQLTTPANGDFESYSRWAVRAGVRFEHPLAPKLGTTLLVAEAIVAQNMDQGTLMAAALPRKQNQAGIGDAARRELGGYVRLEQQLGPVTLATRADYYDPDRDLGGASYVALQGGLAYRFGTNAHIIADYTHTWDSQREREQPEIRREFDTLSLVMQFRMEADLGKATPPNH